MSKGEESVPGKQDNVTAAEKDAAEKAEKAAVAKTTADMAAAEKAFTDKTKTSGKPAAGDNKKGKTDGGKDNKSKVADSKADNGKGGTSASSITSSSTKEGGKKTWLWILLSLLVLAAILVFALRSCNKDNQPGGDTPTEQVIDMPTQESQDTPAQGDQDEPVTSETTADNPSAAESGEPATPAQPAQPTTGGTAQPAQPVPARQTAAPRSETPHARGQLTGDIEQDAKAVIRGEFGNGAERKAALGERYQEIQNKVNEIYRNKQF